MTKLLTWFFSLFIIVTAHQAIASDKDDRQVNLEKIYGEHFSSDFK